MALLRNNNVYVSHIAPIHGWYKSYLEYLYSNTPYSKWFIGHDATFEEDLQALINYFNGLLNKEDLNKYLEETVGRYHTLPTSENEPIDIDAYFRELREVFFDKFIDMVYEYGLSMFPELAGIQNKDIFFAYEKMHFFILDRRVMTYVPNELFTVVRRFDYESSLTGDEWIL